MKKVVRVVGTRPQYMQVPKLKRLLELENCKHILIHTGQHYDPMLGSAILKELGGIKADVNLSVGSGRHGQMTAAIMARLEDALLEIRPDFVVVDGDTNSTLATALVTAKLRIPLAHIEAGLRDFDRNRPEEINRILTDHASDMCLAPISRAMDNLRKEGLSDKSFLSGDFLLDNFIEFLSKADVSIAREFSHLGTDIGLMTLHRPENTDLANYDRFEEILKFAMTRPFPIVFPVHPRTRPAVERFRRENSGTSNIFFIEPVSYLQLLGLLQNTRLVLTDSGGLSREAVWMGAKCLMFFRVDTWHDLLERGWAGIAKGDRSIEAVDSELTAPPLEEVRRFYGSGRAAETTIDILKQQGWL